MMAFSLQNCIKFVKVTGEVVNASDLRQVVYPKPPKGVRIRVIAQNPANPVEEVWWVCSQDGAMGNFFTHPKVEVLSYPEAQAIVETWGGMMPF